MRRLTLAVVTTATLVGAGALALAPAARAQPAPGPAGQPPAVAMPHGPEGSHGAGAWMGGNGPWMHGSEGGAWAHAPGAGPWVRGPERACGERAAERHRALFGLFKTWGLFHRPTDLGLTPADVQTIGEAILLRNGQHDWKVGDVTANADHTVSFAFVTSHGDVVARFSMDTRTGRIVRTD